MFYHEHLSCVTVVKLSIRSTLARFQSFNPTVHTATSTTTEDESTTGTATRPAQKSVYMTPSTSTMPEARSPAGSNFISRLISRARTPRRQG